MEGFDIVSQSLQLKELPIGCSHPQRTSFYDQYCRADGWDGQGFGFLSRWRSVYLLDCVIGSFALLRGGSILEDVSLYDTLHSLESVIMASGLFS
jgi:hypothetical protein